MTPPKDITPGEWTADLNLVKAGDNYIAPVTSPGCNPDAANANARLMAASKKLAEALLPFAKYACDTPHIGEPDCNNCKAHEALTLAGYTKP